MSKVYIVWAKKVQRSYLLWNWKEYKIWRGMDLSFQNSHKKFDKFWPEYSKVLQIFTLLGSLWVKYIFLELKKYRGVIFHKTEEGYKVWRGFDLLFQVWHKDLTNFDLSSKSLKIFYFNGILSTKVYIAWAKKSAEELSFKKLKKDTKYGEESTCPLKIGIRNLTNFDPSTRKSKKCVF